MNVNMFLSKLLGDALSSHYFVRHTVVCVVLTATTNSDYLHCRITNMGQLLCYFYMYTHHPVSRVIHLTHALRWM